MTTIELKTDLIKAVRSKLQEMITRQKQAMAEAQKEANGHAGAMASRYDTFKEEFAEKVIETFARYAPNMTRKNIIGQHVYTGREYVAEFPQMRGGDIFMGAFNAEQVMYNHFGYRTPVPNLYYAGSGAHPGGAISGGPSYITASIIARDLGIKPWWTPWDARAALEALVSSQAA